MNDQKKTDTERRVREDLLFLNHHFERRGALFYTFEAETETDKEIFYKIRSDAFVKDVHIISEANTLESSALKDIYDDHAFHFLTLFKPLKLVIGGIRFVRPLSLDLEHSSFPSAEFSPSLKEFIKRVHPANCLEVSRFLVSKHNAPFISNYIKNTDSYHEELYPDKILYLMNMSYKLCQEHKVQYLIGSFDLYLIHILKKMGIPIKKIGTPLRTFGPVYPFYIDIKESMRMLEGLNTKVFHFLRFCE